MPKIPTLFPIKAGVSLAITDVFPRTVHHIRLEIQYVISSFRPKKMISNNFKYLAGLKKCVPQKCFWKSSLQPSLINLIGIPEVFDVIKVPGVLCFQGFQRPFSLCQDAQQRLQ